MTSTEPTLLFFRSQPLGWAEDPFLASSLQSVETSFFLIALGRYPPALTLCVSAIETCLQAAKIGAKDSDGFQKLARKARSFSSAVAGFPEDLTERLRDFRNQLTHRGFGPEDNSKSVGLYLSAGIPFLSLCYREFHAFDFDGGLLIEYAEQLSLAERVRALVEDSPGVDLSYCLNAFGHLVQCSFKQSFAAGWELEALTHADDTWGKFERIKKEKDSLERLFNAAWSFDCPLCHDVNGVIAELDPDSLSAGKIQILRLACTGCEFVVNGAQRYLGHLLLEKQIPKVQAAILSDYGVE